MFLPYRNQNPPESFPFATVGLIVANVVTYGLTTDMGLAIKRDIAIQGGASIANFHWWQMFSSMFLHGGPLHLIGNMWFLYLFGFAVEGRMRSLKFLLLYVLSGLVGGAAHLLIVGGFEPKIPAIGASGAIMGVMGAAIYMFPHATVDVFWTFWYRIGSSEWKLWWVGAYYVVIDALQAAFSTAMRATGGVANLAHLGGVAAGLLIPWVMRIKRDDEAVAGAKSTLYMTNDVTLLSERELRNLHQTHPARTDIVLQWINKSMYGNGPTRDEAIQAFQKNFPKVLTEQPILPVVHAVNTLLMTVPDALSPRELGQIASKAEREGQYALAVQFYRNIVNNQRATKSDIEGAAFRIAMLLESAFKDYAQARQWYEYVKQNFPMSPIMVQVNARLAFISSQGG